MTTHSKLKQYQRLLSKIKAQSMELKNAGDGWLKEKAHYLTQQAQNGVALDELLTETYSLTCEVAHRVLDMQPYDVQIAAAIAMFQGKLVEMQTGEGKTLAAVLPACLFALNGNGVHILTFNDYLASRDARWMGPIYRFFGLSVAFVQEGMSPQQRREAYAADICYVTAKEAGFDFLRDQQCLHKDDVLQRPFHFAIVDEADSILIDEARVPLVIAGDMPMPEIDRYGVAKLIRTLEPGKDFVCDEYSRDVNFTDDGIERVQKEWGCPDLHAVENINLLSAFNLALQAELLLKRDIDYIIRAGQVKMVDAFTGRIAENRRWPYGLQAAVEAKENLAIQPEGMILGSITLQHFLKLYPKVAGMTATAKTSEQEFETFYGLIVETIPTHHPNIRIDFPDLVFTHKEAKTNALVQEIATVHATGRPILVGTASVEESEQLAGELSRAGVSCLILNAKNDEKEAAIVAEAGALRAVTISTNMAGRGTDIRLGGKNQESRAQVVALGGLYVIGTNRHESRRIDNQLRGRAGRQGDPGSSRFFISLEDDLMVRYHIERLIPERFKPQKQEESLDNKVVTLEIARAQRIIEGENFEIRKTLRHYSFIIEEQRQIIQHHRQIVLLGDESSALLCEHPDTCLRYQHLLPLVGQEILAAVEKQITLFHLDRFWADHLEEISRIREGIHLQGLAGKNPSFEFLKLAIKNFDETYRKMEEAIVATFIAVHITKTGINAEKEGMKRPTATWTYLINDTPFNNPLKQALISSPAFAFGAAFFFVQNMWLLPFIILIGLYRKLRARIHHK